MYVGVIKELLNPHNLQESDIVIVNLGAWYFLGELGQERKYENAVSALVQELKESFPRPKLLWMESTPQHFSGLDNGYFELDNAKKNMYDIGSGSGSGRTASIRRQWPSAAWELFTRSCHRLPQQAGGAAGYRTTGYSPVELSLEPLLRTCGTTEETGRL